MRVKSCNNTKNQIKTLIKTPTQLEVGQPPIIVNHYPVNILIIIQYFINKLFSRKGDKK